MNCRIDFSAFNNGMDFRNKYYDYMRLFYNGNVNALFGKMALG